MITLEGINVCLVAWYTIMEDLLPLEDERHFSLLNFVLSYFVVEMLICRQKKMLWTLRQIKRSIMMSFLIMVPLQR
jgi:hypothetical protein